jgi:hypothetical protein
MSQSPPKDARKANRARQVEPDDGIGTHEALLQRAREHAFHDPMWLTHSKRNFLVQRRSFCLHPSGPPKQPIKVHDRQLRFDSERACERRLARSRRADNEYASHT